MTYPRLEDVLEACRRAEESTDNPGFCLGCGEEQEGCEPDARNIICECCGEAKVHGAEEILLMGAHR